MCKECEEKASIKISSEKLQELIDLCFEENENLNLKTCTKCNRKLPTHKWFFNKHPLGKYGFDSKCRECINEKFSFENIIKEQWYEKNKVNIKLDLRRMSIRQISEHYNLTESEINYFIRKEKIKLQDTVNTLTKDEVIYMYKSLLNEEILCFRNGFYNKGNNYYKIILKYLFEYKLKYSRQEICKYVNTDFLNKYKLSGIITQEKTTIIEVLNEVFPQYDIKPWELLNSSCKWTDKNILELKSWLLIKLKDKNINSINESGTYGFQNLAEEFRLLGLCSSKFDNSAIKLFEYIYDEKFNKNEMLQMNYNFEINTTTINKCLENIIYKLTDKYNTLDDRGKTLINEIIRFCEDNNKFPDEKELTNKRGYISRTQFYKYFNCSNLSKVYEYIIPLDDGKKGGGKKKLVNIESKPPETAVCIRCNIKKPFSLEYFSSGKNSKYGLKYLCKECEAKESTKKRYLKLGIFYNNIEDISPEQWYEYYYTNSKMTQMPEHCYIDKNLVLVLRYIFINKEFNNSREQIIQNANKSLFEKYKIDMIVNRLGGKIKMLQLCFPEYDFQEEEFEFNKYTEEYKINVIENVLKKYNYSIINILNSNAIYKNTECKECKDLQAMLGYCFYANNLSMIDMFLWYFEFKNISHPLYNRKINRYDFAYQTKNYYMNSNNRIDRIKYYCENQCEENILNNMNTEMLKKWAYKYFKQEDVVKYNLPYTPYNRSLYDVLIEAYPNIKENKILFDWEWHQIGKYKNTTLKRMIREVILYRLNDIVIDLEKDIPKYINKGFMKEVFPKFNKHIDRKRFKSYYEWCCEAFPEYRDKWTKEMFGHIISKDGKEFDSFQEKNVYEQFKLNPLFKYIKPIGRNKSGKYAYLLNEEYVYERFCPDFVIEDIHVNGKKHSLNKPIIVEYYGMYCENNKHKIYQNYKIKTEIKEEFYKSRDDIYYIGIFPEDIKNNYEGLKKKLESFLLLNFNIDMHNKDNYIIANLNNLVEVI